MLGIGLGITSLRGREARRNILIHSEDLSNAAWVRSGMTISGYTVTTTLSGAALHQKVAVSPGQVLTFSWYAQRGTMTDAAYSVYDWTGNANIIASTSYYAQINASDLTRVSVTFTVPPGCVSAGVYPLRASGVTGTIILGGPEQGAQVELGAAPSPYQRIGATF